MNKFLLFVASLFASVASFAQWTKPAAPAVEPMSVGTELYLYNKDAGGFLLGANEWNTRASYSSTLGHKVYIENGVSDGSYYITNYVLQGGMANQIGYMFIDGPEAIYVDNTKEGKNNNQYTFEPQGDGTYKIGLSVENNEYNPAGFPGAYIGGIGDKNDTRLYVCAPDEYPDNVSSFQLIWYFVTPANYEAYITANAQYEAAVALGESIEKAKAAGVDTSAAQAVYGNTSSTAAELSAAKATLDEAIKNAGFAAATKDNPYTVAFFDFENKDISAWASTVSAQNKGADNGNAAADHAVTGIHYENWHPSNFSLGGKIYTTAKAVPAGVYHLTALAYTSSGTGATLFADKGKAPVSSTQIDAANSYDVYTFLQETQDIEFGLLVDAGVTNWVGLDNVKLEYIGTAAESYLLVSEQALANYPDFESIVEEGAYCQKSLYDAYKTAKADLLAAKDPTEMAKAIDAFEAACTALAPSIDAYGTYYAKVDEANEWLTTATSQGEEIDILSDYLGSDEAEDYNGNGGAVCILENGTLETAQIEAEIAYINKLLNDAMAAGMKDGDDCTELLKNPNFTEAGGWNAAQGIEWPVGTEDFRVFQAWGRVADVYQQLSGLQNGIYEMNLQAVYHPGDANDAEIRQTYAYINDFDTKIPVDPEDAPITSSEDAAAQFAAGTYPVKVYGLVTDGTMKIGIANRLRTHEQGILWAGGVSLIFRAKNEEACKSMTAVLTEQAKALSENYCGTNESTALVSAVEKANAAEDGSEAYNALKALKFAIDGVNESTTLYSNLNVAIAGLEEAIENNPNADAMVVATAQEVLADAKAGYASKSYDNEAIAKAIEDVNAQAVAVKLGKIQASEDNPVDMTAAIVNNNFDPAKGSKDEKRIDGWSVEGALNGYKSYSCSFNKGTFDLHQDLAGLPKGKYKVTVHTYYRAGSYEEEGANILAGKDTHLMKLYANTADDNFETNVMNLSEGSQGVTLPEGIGTKEINGIVVPDGTGASVACYEAGLFLNELTFTVGEDGKATIGLKLPETIGTNDYTVVGAWNLLYMGDSAPSVQDLTNLIVNNNFDPAKGSKDEKRIDGWSVEGALNGYKSYSCSFNKGAFDLHQDLAGLPKGNYKVTVNTYYRAGSYEEEEANILAGKDTHLMKFYANTSVDNYETNIMNLSEGSKDVTLPEGIGTKVVNGITVPDGTGASVACYEAGLFLNELSFTVGEDGKATIGLKLPETIGSNDYTVVGPWHLYYYGDNAQAEKSDVSSLIVNRTFDPAKGSKDEKRIDGWSVEGALNGYKSYTCSFNKGTFDLHQDLAGLPEGTYEVTVHTYYRAGSYEEEEANILAGKDTHLMKLYANTADENYATSIMNLSEGSQGVTLPEGIGTKVINGITVPDGTGASAACYEAGLFLNSLKFYVGNDGKVTIGLCLPETIGSNDYTVVGEWNLYYYGAGNQLGTSIERVEEADRIVETATPVAYYSINGARLSAPQKGINLVKMSNGATLKMIVK